MKLQKMCEQMQIKELRDVQQIKELRLELAKIKKNEQTDMKTRPVTVNYKLYVILMRRNWRDRVIEHRRCTRK